MAATQVHEPGTAVLVAVRLIVMRGVIWRIGVEHMLDEVRDLLGKLDRRKHGEQQQERDQPHEDT